MISYNDRILRPQEYQYVEEFLALPRPSSTYLQKTKRERIRVKTHINSYCKFRKYLPYSSREPDINKIMFEILEMM